MISRMTAAIIQSRDDLIYTSAFDKRNNKHQGWITLPPEQYCRELLTTDSIFDTQEEAENYMTGLRDDLRQLPDAFSKEFDEAWKTYCENTKKNEND